MPARSTAPKAAPKAAKRAAPNAAPRAATKAPPLGRPIFIFSCARTGSTLLRYVLDTHPAIFAPAEMALGDLSNLLYYTHAALRGVKQPSLAWREDPDVLAGIRRTLTGLLEPAARERGKTIWCEKSPSNLNQVDLLVRLFPEARAICLYRNHLDTIHSCLGVSRYGFLGILTNYLLRSPDNYVAAFARYWVEGNSKLLDLERRRPESTHRLLYEDLVRRPEEALAGLFAFLDLPWSSDLIEAVFKTAHGGGPGDPYVEFSGKIHDHNVGSGRDLPVELIPPDLATAIEELNRELGFAELVGEILRRPDAPPPPMRSDGAGDAGDGPRWLFESHLPERLAAHRERLPALGRSYRFVISGDGGGEWLVDLGGDGGDFRVVPGAVAGASEAETTIGLAAADLLGIAGGRLNALKVLEEGRIAVFGQPPTAEQFLGLVELVRTGDRRLAARRVP
jgi:protein-tyrosine sulfotransferase